MRNTIAKLPHLALEYIQSRVRAIVGVVRGGKCRPEHVAAGRA